MTPRPKQLERWIRLYNTGVFSIKVLADDEDVSFVTMKMALVNAGIRLRSGQEPIVPTIGSIIYKMKMVNPSLTWQQIADQLNNPPQRTAKYVQYLANKYSVQQDLPHPNRSKRRAKIGRLSKKRQKFSDETKARWAEMYAVQNLSLTEISRIEQILVSTLKYNLILSGVTIRPWDRVTTKHTGRLAYNMRLEQHLPWAEIAKKLTPKSNNKNLAATVVAYARSHAIATGKIWPIPRI